MKDTKILTVKDIVLLSEVSYSTAQRIYSAIKKQFNIRFVCYKHYKQYYFLD